MNVGTGVTIAVVVDVVDGRCRVYTAVVVEAVVVVVTVVITIVCSYHRLLEYRIKAYCRVA